MSVEVMIPVPYVAVVTINRPPVNALDRETRLELVRIIDELQERSDVRCLVLTATGKVFCAGADIKEKGKLFGTTGLHSKLMRDILTQI